MKKLILVLSLFLFSIVSFSQERELSDYEKYRLEQEAKDHPSQGEEVFYIVEDMPKFKGENAKFFRTWIAKHVKYPGAAAQDGIEGKVIVSFVVNKYGDVVNAKIEKSVDPHLDAESIRVVESSPKWKAGKQNGEPVNVQFTFPIQFVLDEVAEEPVVVNNYYVQSDFRHSLYFGYSWNYQPYGYPSYGAWYGGYYDYYAYYGAYYPYYGYNHYPYYSYNYWGYYPYSRNYYRGNNRYYANNSFGRRGNSYNYKTYRSGNVNTATPYRSSKSAVRPQTRSQTVQKSTVRPQTTRQNQTMNRTQDRNSYSPNYRKPAPNQRAQYNRQSSTTVRKSNATRTQSQQRSSATYQRPAQKSTQSRGTYQRSSTPSKSQGYSRSSGASRSGGSVSRSSSSYSRSSVSRSSGSSGGGSSRSSSKGGRK